MKNLRQRGLAWRQWNYRQVGFIDCALSQFGREKQFSGMRVSVRVSSFIRRNIACATKKIACTLHADKLIRESMLLPGKTKHF